MYKPVKYPFKVSLWVNTDSRGLRLMTSEIFNISLPNHNKYMPRASYIWIRKCTKDDLKVAFASQYRGRVQYENTVSDPVSGEELLKTDVYTTQIEPNIDLIYELYLKQYNTYHQYVTKAYKAYREYITDIYSREV